MLLTILETGDTYVSCGETLDNTPGAGCLDQISCFGEPRVFVSAPQSGAALQTEARSSKAVTIPVAF